MKRKLHLEPNEKASKRAKVSTTTDKAKKQKPKENKAVPAAKSNPAHKLRPQQRNQLAKELRLLRKYFAIAQGVARNEEYKIFPSRSIDEIIQKLPSNSSELMQCWGIKEKRLAQYGSAILLVVQPYLSQNNNHQQRQQQQNHNQQQQQQQLQTPTSLDEVRNLSVKALKILATKFGIDTNVREKSEVQNDLWEAIHPTIETDSGAHKVDNSDSDDEEVEITRQLTVEEIVAQRVREAEARGEVFEIL